MKKRFIIFYVAAFCIVVGLSFAMPASSAILFYEDFEDALDFVNDWSQGAHDGSHEITTEQAKSGSKSYKFSVTSQGEEYVKEGMVAVGFNNGDHHFTIGDEYWTGFSIFLADGYSAHGVVHHQYHGEPDNPPTCDPREAWRNPALTVASTTYEQWQTSNIWDSHQCTIDKDYDGSYWSDDGVFSTGQWYDFVINVKWSYGAGGFLKVWRNGVLVTDRIGGNCFNDNKGPYLWIGIYSYHIGQGQTTTIYYDELRIGDSDSSYSEVAPRGNVKLLPPPSVQVTSN